MSKITWGSVWKRADRLGLRLDQLGGHRAGGEKFWLTKSVNWVTTTPGRTLAEISAELDEREAEIARQEA